MAANGPFPIGSHIVLRRVKDGWQVMSSYPKGYTITENGMPFETRRQADLAAVYVYLLHFHQDDVITSGHAPQNGPTTLPSAIPDGAIVDIERRADGWHSVVDFASGGLVFRSAAYRSIGEVLEGLRLNHTTN